MNLLLLLSPILGLATAWPHPSGSGYVSSSTTPSATGHSSSSKTHSSHVIQPTGHPIGTGSYSSLSTTTVTVPDSSASSISSVDDHSASVITSIWEVTSTKTSFVPKSSAISNSGELTYYTTWLSATFPTTVIVSTEYITATVQPPLETVVTTVAPSVTPLMTIPCICPAPVTETVYVMATAGPATTITSALLHTYTSTLANGQTSTTIIPVSPPASSAPVVHTFTSTMPNGQVTTTCIPIESPTTSTKTVPPSETSDSPTSTITSTTIKTITRPTGTESHTKPTGTASHTKSTGTGTWTHPTGGPVVSQIPDGQVQAPAKKWFWRI